MLLILDFHYLIRCFRGFCNKYILNLVNVYYILFLYNKIFSFLVLRVVSFLPRYFLFGNHFLLLLLLLYLRIVSLLLFFLQGFLLLHFFEFHFLLHYYYYYLFHYYFLDFLNYYFLLYFFYSRFLLFLRRILYYLRFLELLLR